MTKKSAVLLPFGEPLCSGPLMDAIVPPQIVSRRGAPEYCSAPLTDSPLALYLSDGNAALDEDGSPGHMDEIAPPLPAQMRSLAFVTFQVARKS